MSAFNHLHPSIQQVLWDLKWEQLRELQVNAIEAWHADSKHILLMANTAAGKTEAAFLPILSSIAADKGVGSVRALYIGPLKALINDQFRRVEELCVRAEIPVHRWHGDVGSNRKEKVLQDPTGILLITPESLEALFIRRGREMHRLFERLECIVIDEMHVFLDSERGRQLITQLARLDAIRRNLPPARRIGLSATIGGAEYGRYWLGACNPESVTLISSSATQNIELLIKTVLGDTSRTALESDDDEYPLALFKVAQHILKSLYGGTHLIFGNRKSDLEFMVDVLKRICEKEALPDRFRIHHGSLSKNEREETELELQSGRACTVLCSSTLELGIDVGQVDSVGQIDPPFSVSSLKQRLGRSGRRKGSAARLWLYIPLEEVKAEALLSERLYPDVLQSIALVDLLREKWVEPARNHAFDFSTLIQQLLSLIAERGGVQALAAFRLLTQSPAFTKLTPDLFSNLLKDLGHAALIEQTLNGDLILGIKGESLVNNYEFYAAFFSADDIDVFHGGHLIGSVGAPLIAFKEGDNFVLAGLRWEVLVFDEARNCLQVRRSSMKQPIRWSGKGGFVHERVRSRMRELLAAEDYPTWINTETIEILRRARVTAKETGAHCHRWIPDNQNMWLMTWTSDRMQHTLELLFLAAGLSKNDLFNGAFCFCFPSSTTSKIRHVLELAQRQSPVMEDVLEVVFSDRLPPSGKHSRYLSPRLAKKAYISANTDLDQLMHLLPQLAINAH